MRFQKDPDTCGRGLSFWLYCAFVVLQIEEILESPLTGFFDRNQNCDHFKYLWQFASLC